MHTRNSHSECDGGFCMADRWAKTAIGGQPPICTMGNAGMRTQRWAIQFTLQKWNCRLWS
jgi:hypothetical protein